METFSLVEENSRLKENLEIKRVQNEPGGFDEPFNFLGWTPLHWLKLWNLGVQNEPEYRILLISIWNLYELLCHEKARFIKIPDPKKSSWKYQVYTRILRTMPEEPLSLLLTRANHPTTITLRMSTAWYFVVNKIKTIISTIHRETNKRSKQTNKQITKTSIYIWTQKLGHCNSTKNTI